MVAAARFSPSPGCSLDIARNRAFCCETRFSVHLQLQQDFSSSVAEAYRNLEVPLQLRVREPVATAVTAVWFLLRGLEVDNVTGAVLELVVRRRSCDPSHPLFGDGQVAVTPRQLTQLARVCAFVLQRETLSDWSPSALDKWSQHCFRVAGAQLFARAGVALPVIQVIGRWGSMSVMRYVQDAIFVPDRTAFQVGSALTAVPHSEPSSSSHPSAGAVVNRDEIDSAVRRVRRVVAECWQSRAVFVHNTRTKFAHRPCENEQALQSFNWVSVCRRWHYGSCNHLRHPSVLPGFVKCAKCFPEESVGRSAQAQPLAASRFS